MRHMQQRRRTQAKRPVQWVVSSSSFTNAFSTVTAGAVSPFILAETAPQSATEASISIDRVTVMRIKGDLLVSTTGAAAYGVLFSVGIAVVDRVGGTDDQWDPSAVANGPKAWMYLRHYYLQESNTVSQTGPLASSAAMGVQLPTGTHVDVKVKRIIRPEQSLKLFVIQRTVGAAATVSVMPLFRTLVSRAI